ncbi:DUF2773 domain-containing protein, partial [Escherichia coli]|uniref:DUF2773 domain-containing protein n=1 Tax=Escherichia coli TaxID=562 RepID=UPI00234D8F7A
VCVVGRMRDLILQLSKSSIYSTKPWWSTLAKSNLTFFKFGALNNRHTPPAVLAAEIDPEWWIVAMNNPRFPVDVLKARLKRDPLLALELVNPELDLVRQLALNGKTRAIREQAMRKLDELY